MKDGIYDAEMLNIAVFVSDGVDLHSADMDEDRRNQRLGTTLPEDRRERCVDAKSPQTPCLP